MKIDDQKLGEAEVLLGGLNCTVQLSALKGFECNPILRELSEAIRRELRTFGADIAHLKITLVPEVDVEGLATLNVRRNLPLPELGPELEEPVERGRLDVNLHAEAKPDHLAAALTRAMNHTWEVFPQLFARLAEMQHLAPQKSSGGQAVGVS